MSNFRISHWCGIPHRFIRRSDGTLAVDRIYEMRESGINLMAAYDYGVKTNIELLRECERLGMKVTLSDSRISEAIRSPENRRELLCKVCEDYRGYSALFAYHLTDEPSSMDFRALGDVVSILEELDPKHESYINLFPNYASPEQLGSSSYTEHIYDYVREVQPKIISFDHYHFLKPKSGHISDCGSERENAIRRDAEKRQGRPGFFDNLEEIRTLSLDTGIPFMVILLVTEHGPYRNLREAEIRYEVFQSLAYGASGISYFTYWTPGVDSDEGDDHWHWKNGMIAKNGDRNPHYYDIKRINSHLSVIGNKLLGRKSLSVLHIGDEPDRKVSYFSERIGGIRALLGNDLTLGEFEGGYILLASKRLSGDNEVSFSLDLGKKALRLQRESGEWVPLQGSDESYTLSILPGDGELIKIT